MTIKPNTYRVTIHCRWDEVGMFESYPDCKNVENDGPILCFTDSQGIFRKTSAPWTIQREADND